VTGQLLLENAREWQKRTLDPVLSGDLSFDTLGVMSVLVIESLLTRA
jgi:hypothetical protein